MAPMEPWERVWIDAETYPEDVHSLINCTTCHGGVSDDNMDLAHQMMVESPTEDAQATCGSCHPGITEAAIKSLHNTLAGYDTAVYERSVPENHPIIEEMEQYHCNDCHATCGDCHISQPSSVGGGLVNAHIFNRTPSMSQNCTACHGSRVKDEYYGAHEGLTADVHFRGRMACSDCHTSQEMHGVGIDAAHRYDGEQGPACESCHQEQVGAGSGIEQHEIHGTESVACQVCHSVEYTQCTNCHVARNNEDIPFFSVESHSLGFFIGRNTLRDANRPYEYVLVRHVPIDINSFSFYGDNLLPNFDARPTWTYATPHNIQRNTPQTESCIACHTNDAIFLTVDKVVPQEVNANLDVIVESAPPLPDGYENVTTGETDAAPSDASSGGDDFWGSGSEDETESETPDTGGDFWGAEPESETPTTESSGDSGGFWGADSGSEAEASDDPNGSFWDTDAPTEEEADDDNGGSFWDTDG